MQLWTAFLLGLAGSLHCAAMCGPLVLGLARSGPATRRPFIERLVYHVGRVGAYCLLGFGFGLLGHLVAMTGFQKGLSIGIGIVLLAGLLASKKLSLASPVWTWVTLLKRGMGSLLKRESTLAHLTLGGLNGLLPCGLVYVAAAGATVTGHPVAGLAYMALFGLGTWPVMLAIHVGARGIRLPSGWTRGGLTRGAVGLLAVLMILRGLELGIPLVSPDLSAGQGESCHGH